MSGRTILYILYLYTMFIFNKPSIGLGGSVDD